MPDAPVDPLSQMNTQLYGIYTHLTELQGVEVNALTKQTSIMDMVKKENARLTNKQETIDQAVENQKRIIYFNDNSRKVSAAWLKILITVVITLALLYIVRIISFYGFLPDMAFNVLVIFIISIGFIVIFNYYSGIRARDRYNFDELRLKNPNMGYFSTPSPNSSIPPLAYCMGEQCCPPEGNTGATWNGSIGKCISTSPGTSSPGTSSPGYSDNVGSNVQS